MIEHLMDFRIACRFILADLNNRTVFILIIYYLVTDVVGLAPVNLILNKLIFIQFYKLIFNVNLCRCW